MAEQTMQEQMKKNLEEYEARFVEAMLTSLDDDLAQLYKFAVDSNIASVDLVRQILMMQQTRNGRPIITGIES